MDINESFYQEEIRCNFLVTKERKRLWAFQLDLLSELDRICKKYDIRYFAGGGTMLGAVRHKGYIPWDDDIDINMFRKDYDRFCNVAVKELREPYFLQTPMTDIDYASYHIKLRNSNTTCTTKYDMMFEYNQGVFIDIFPYDYIPDEQRERESFLCEIRKYRRMLDVGMRKFYHINGVIVPEDEQREIRDFFEKNSFRDVCRHYDELCAKYADSPTKNVGVLAYAIEGKLSHPTDWFDDFICADFEMMRMPIPKEFDKYLSLHYGHYMELKKTKGMHGELIFLPDTPYKDYLAKEKT